MARPLGAGSSKSGSSKSSGSSLGRLVRNVAKGGVRKAAYEDVEGLTVSLGVIFALLLPAAMVLQNSGFDEGVKGKNFLLLLCTRPDFRSYVVETMLDSDTGDVGQYQAELFAWHVTLGGGKFLDTKAVLQGDSTLWEWDGRNPEALYLCAMKREIAGAARALQEHFPQWRTDTWALMNPEAPLWSDHLSAMNSFGMCTFMGGLLGSLMLYISLSLSAGREDSSGAALEKWNVVGFPLLFLNLLFLMGAIMVLMFANDAYSESQDPFFLRSGGRMGAYAKIALVGVFFPIALIYIVGSLWALGRSCQEEPTKQAVAPEQEVTVLSVSPVGQAKAPEGRPADESEVRSQE